MATIRVRDWTKEQIEEIRDAESHSSHDSVIKTLLKDRELSQFVTDPSSRPETVPAESDHSEPDGTAFEDLTVLEEITTADNGVLFLWCPSCSNEIAHIGGDSSISWSVFEVKCQRCLSRLDQHAIVGIEIGYPIEQRLVEETLRSDLKRCVMDYWERMLGQFADGSLGEDADDDHLVWKFGDYRRSFGWEWPDDAPVIDLEAGQTYRNEATGQLIDVVEPTTDRRNTLDDYRVRKRTEGTDDDRTEIIDANTVMGLIVSRQLYPEATSERED